VRRKTRTARSVLCPTRQRTPAAAAAASAGDGRITTQRGGRDRQRKGGGRERGRGGWGRDEGEKDGGRVGGREEMREGWNLVKL